MEDVLDLYAEPYDPARPVVCIDERPVQLLDNVRAGRPVAPGRPARQDYEYLRCGTANLFFLVEPLAGWRHVEATDQRTKIDFARQMKRLVDERYPDAERIRVVLDNLNTHTLGSLYLAFEPAEARRIARKLEFHHTPTHGSWLNMAEVEIAVCSRQCLARRIPSIAALRDHVTPWQAHRNDQRATISWRFSAADARTKLQWLYP